MAGRYRSRSEKKKLAKQLSITLFVMLAVCMIAVIVFATADQMPQPVEYTSTETEPETEDLGVITLNGERYVPKRNVETYLFMGIDEPGEVQERTEYTGTGQCDTLILFVRDKSEGTYRTVHIDRNTMMDVKSIAIDGTYLATTKNQVSLAHSDGNGLEMSCENVVDAVSSFLYGQKIDGYAAVNMGAIGTINHLIGGVTVTIEDDFSQMDPTLVMGETVTLNDTQAVSYVRGRMNVGDGSNESRVRRQGIYLAQAETKVRALCNSDGKFPMVLYEGLGAYMVTDIPAKKFSKIALLAAKDKSEGSLTIEGERIIGDMEFEEFWADEESLESVLAQLFYRKYE